MSEQGAERPRTEAQIASEKRREERSQKTKVRHTPESLKALARLRRRKKGASDAELLRLGVIRWADET